jgi:hypothetical protein
METFETVLAHATDPATREVLAAIGLVINGESMALLLLIMSLVLTCQR